MLLYTDCNQDFPSIDLAVIVDIYVIIILLFTDRFQEWPSTDSLAMII